MTVVGMPVTVVTMAAAGRLTGRAEEHPLHGPEHVPGTEHDADDGRDGHEQVGE